MTPLTTRSTASFAHGGSVVPRVSSSQDATPARRLRIAVVTPMLPVPHDLTRGRFTHETVRALSRLADVRVFFQTMRYPQLPGMRSRSYVYGEVASDYSLPDVDVEAFAYPAIPVLSRAINGFVGAAALKPRVAAFRPDVVVGYWVYPDGFAALLTARSIGVPCVIGALGSDVHVRHGLNAAYTRHTLRRADAVVTVSEAMRRAAIETFGAKPEAVTTIVNGFNTGVFGPVDQASARASLGIASDVRLALYVGRLVEAKGLRELIAAARSLASADPLFRLAIVGDGGMKAELHDLVQAAGLADRTWLPGGLPPAQVARWIGAADLLTLPSWSEGYPNVVVEAIACGRPVVATDVGGTSEIVNTSNGILVEPRNPAALGAALQQALDRRWDHAGIAAAMKRSWDHVAAETLAVCQSVARQSGRNR